MRSHLWLDALDHELTTLGVPVELRSAAVVETQSYLSDADQDPVDEFGPPEDYALVLAEALGPDRLRRRPDAAAPSLLSVANVAKAHRRIPVLTGITVEVRAGDVVAVVGRNGVGKTTLLRLMAGLSEPDLGTVERLGSIGYSPQEGGLDPLLTADEHCTLFGSLRGLDRRSAVAEGRTLAEQLGWAPEPGQVAETMSGGTRQKLRVITAMLGHPDLLLLDEPYQGLDADSTRRFWDLLWDWADNGGAAVVSSHAADLLRRATTVVELEPAAVAR